MTLKDALGLRDEEMLALIGAGGKTTTLFRLAHELFEEGKKVLVTTTTKIFKPAKPHVQKLYVARDLDVLLGELSKIKEPMVVGVGHGLDEAGKLVGLPPKWFAPLVRSATVDWILIEADGAAMKPFKVPLEHEPVVPEGCPLTVWVMGIKALGQPLDEQHIHRAKRAAELLGVELGTPLTEAHILRLAQHPDGSLKGIPRDSRKIALLNQADCAEEVEKARSLGQGLLKLGLERVVITSYVTDDAVKGVLSSQF